VATSTTRKHIQIRLLLFAGIANRNRPANSGSNPSARNGCAEGAVAPLVGAVVETVRVLVIPDVPVMLIEVGERLQVGRSLGFEIDVLTAQVRLTLPVKPFEGVTVIVTVFPTCEPAGRLRLPLLLAESAGAAVATKSTTES
jgi:hypothetical protein